MIERKTEREVRLEKMLTEIELLRHSIMYDINALGMNTEAIRRTTVYPMARFKPLIVDDYPVFQYSYEGVLPQYKENDHEYISMIRHYYYGATLDSYDYSKMELPVIEKGVMIFVHYFKNKLIRDLDNRNRKDRKSVV